MNEQLRNKLVRMAARDLRVREELAATGELFDGYSAKMEAVHLENADALEAVIDTGGGWPGASMIGADGAEAAWLVAMHAISRPAFQRRCLALLEEAAAAGEAEAYQPAYLFDRIALFEGRPQRYGTQSDWNEEGKMEIGPLEDAACVNELRASVGLAPLENLVWENEETREHAPKDFARRRREYEEWKVKVGWIEAAGVGRDEK